MRILCYAILTSSAVWAQSGPFQIEEASIRDIQNAIRGGRTTCQGVVEAYIERAKAYNGACTALVTKDGASVPAATGMVRAGEAITYPTKTVAASTLFPDSNDYSGPPLEFGRMESSVTDPNVPIQVGMRVGIPKAGQVNALEALNIRGERSVTCHGDFDRKPSAGPLPPGAPAVCEEFRKQPDALGTRGRTRQEIWHETPTSPICRCTAQCSPSRIGMTRRTCAGPAATM